MNPLQKHLRNTFITGIFAAIPLAVTIFVIVKVEEITHALLFKATGIKIPFVGVVVAIVAIYLMGLGINSVLGRILLRTLDRGLLHLPVVRDLYHSWKQVALTPGGKEGMFAKVVLVAIDRDDAKQIGFTSGEPLPGDSQSCCVFIPNAPNPITGRLYFVRRELCQPIDITADDALKIILSNGNYVPQQMTLGD